MLELCRRHAIETMCRGCDQWRAAAWRARITLVLVVLTCVSCSESGNNRECNPKPGSCDADPPRLSPVNDEAGCLGAPVALARVCSTSVSRCAPSAGLGPVCAFAPDGGVFVALGSDNFVLSAAGWQFVEAFDAFPDAQAIPAAQLANSRQYATCQHDLCLPSCFGVSSLHYCPSSSVRSDAATAP